MLVGWILLGVGFLVLMPFGLFHAARLGTLAWAMLRLLASAALMIVGGLLALVGFYARFVPGAGELARVRPEFGTASALVKVGYLGGLIAILVGAALLVVLIGLPLLVVGAVLLLLGHVGAALLSFKMHDVYGNSLYLAAGVLVLLSVVFPILAFIVWVLLYVALGETIGKLRAAPAP